MKLPLVIKNNVFWLCANKSFNEIRLSIISTCITYIYDGSLLSHYQHSTHCHLLQVKNMPPSVTKRLWHSMSTIAASHSCVWLMAVGGNASRRGGIYASSCVFLELSEWNNESVATQVVNWLSISFGCCGWTRVGIPGLALVFRVDCYWY